MARPSLMQGICCLQHKHSHLDMPLLWSQIMHLCDVPNFLACPQNCMQHMLQHRSMVIVIVTTFALNFVVYLARKPLVECTSFCLPVGLSLAATTIRNTHNSYKFIVSSCNFSKSILLRTQWRSEISKLEILHSHQILPISQQQPTIKPHTVSQNIFSQVVTQFMKFRKICTQGK